MTNANTRTRPSHTKPNRATRRIIPLLAVGAALALGLTGCMKTVSAFTLNADDTYTASAVVAYEAEFVDQAAQSMGQTREQFMADMKADAMSGQTGVDLGADATIEDYDEDGYIGWRFVNDQAQPIAAIGAAGSSGAQFSVTRQGEEFMVSVDMDLTDAGGSAEELNELGMDPATLADQVIIEVSFTFPGPVSSGDGVISGNTVTFSPVFGELSQFSAVGSAVGGAAPVPSDAPDDETDEPDESASASPEVAAAPGSTPDSSATPISAPGESAFPLWAALVAAGVALVVAGLVIWLVVRRRRKAVADAAPAGPSAPPGGYGPLPSAPGTAAMFGAGPVVPTAPTEAFQPPAAPTQPMQPAQPVQPTQPQPYPGQPPVAPPVQPPASPNQFPPPPPAAPPYQPPPGQ
ncbi:MAG: hypothetical protein LBK95_17320 [Bifidobacteriaceae bacterium]|jgi:hypothetical protein|nr:hypothetical protein [Bifidobacteriaceae bacterium]